jgi:transposase-like protein
VSARRGPLRPAPRVPPTEAAAYELLEQLRWGGEPAVCPHCGTAGRCRYLAPRVGTSRPTRTGSASQRRVWKCAACGRQFSVLVATVLQGTRLSVRSWIAVADACGETGRLPTAGELTREHGLGRDSARQVIRRLRVALEAAGFVDGDLLAALVRLPPGEAARIRDATPPRVRPRPQQGPSADYR